MYAHIHEQCKQKCICEKRIEFNDKRRSSLEHRQSCDLKTYAQFNQKMVFKMIGISGMPNWTAWRSTVLRTVWSGANPKYVSAA